jgi:hypothetical protein
MILFFEALLVINSAVITWFMFYVLYRLVSDDK